MVGLLVIYRPLEDARPMREIRYRSVLNYIQFTLFHHLQENGLLKVHLSCL